MNRFFTLFFMSCFFSLLFTHSQAQLIIDDSYTAEEMVTDFFDGTCVEVSNITYSGGENAFSFFDASATDLGTNAGILLTSGTVENALGPNEGGGTSGAIGTTGDPDLDSLIPGFTTNDAAILEMDIVAFNTDSISFAYSFGSEEYPEYVCSSFNDVFAFFIEGPGLELTNIANIPGTMMPVSINTINDGNANGSSTNCSGDYDQYFVSNYDSTSILYNDLEYDGVTTIMTAATAITPGETYHVKIAVADAGDSVLDSGVFLSIASLCGDEELLPITDGNFGLSGKSLSLENNSRYGTSHLWDFGDGTTSTERHPAPHEYAEDGTYIVSLTVSNYCCESGITKEVNTLTGEITDYVEQPTSIENNASMAIELYPNPAKGWVNISIPSNEIATINLYDISGKQLLQTQSIGSTQLNINQFEQSVLFVEVITENQVTAQKLIKAK